MKLFKIAVLPRMDRGDNERISHSFLSTRASFYDLKTFDVSHLPDDQKKMIREAKKKADVVCFGWGFVVKD